MALQYLAQAFGAVLTPMNMGVLLLSTFAGLIMGMLPGLSATMAVALLTGLTYRCRTDFADIQNKKECGGNRQWQNHYLRNWAANTKGKGII
uniref:hypothetical protein n=1 Tax=Enterocloster aldenensis TaxID=358742 RepID=UPI001F265639